MFPSLMLAASAANQGIVTLTGATISASDPTPSFDTTVGIRFNPDGTVEEGTSIDGAAITWSQISAGSDWIFPTDYADSSYEVGYTNLVGTPGFDTEAAVEDAFVDLGTQRVWTWNETNSGNDSWSVDFRIRQNGTQLAIATFTFQIDNTA